jgi:hypothetical protein
MKNVWFLFVASILMTLAGAQAAPYAIAAREVHLNGYNLFVDSFDSADPLWSTDGHYDPAKGGRDQAVVASEAGILNSINMGNVELWGRLETAFPFVLAFGPESSIGSASGIRICNRESNRDFTPRTWSGCSRTLCHRSQGLFLWTALTMESTTTTF